MTVSNNIGISDCISRRRDDWIHNSPVIQCKTSATSMWCCHIVFEYFKFHAEPLVPQY